MKRRRVRKNAANPFLVWSGLAFKTGEMMMASAQVISHRVNRIALAGPAPSERDQREFALMGQEKIEAAAESAQAMAARVLNLNQQIGTLAFKQLLMGTSSFISLATSCNIAQSSKLQAKLVCDTVSSLAAAVSQLTDSVAKVAHKGLKPIHSRATANAKRLAKLK
jgi:hypothetical protein